MVKTFKTLKGFNRVNRQNWFQFRDQSNNRATRSTVSVLGEEQIERENILFKESVRLDSRKNFFSVRVVDKWNIIPDKVKAQKTINGFKQIYDEWIESKTRI